MTVAATVRSHIPTVDLTYFSNSSSKTVAATSCPLSITSFVKFSSFHVTCSCSYSPANSRFDRHHRHVDNSTRTSSSFLSCCASSSSSTSFPADHGNEVEMAVASVVEILVEFGASREDSVRVANNCPKYIDALLANVRELDEHSLWDSWKAEMEELLLPNDPSDDDHSPLSFRNKLYYMAKRKGDKGVLPFLESLGLARSSIMHIARYLSSESLPNLITKIEHMREILLSGSHEILIGKNARRMMMQLSIPIDEDIQQTLSFFEKMEAKRGGLSMLGFSDSCLPFMIESFPRLLLLSVEQQLKPLFLFLQSVGVPKENIKDILLLFPPIIFYNIDKDIKPRISALEKVFGGGKVIGKILIKYPWIISTSIMGNYKEIGLFFEQEKIPRSSLVSAAKSWPHLLGCSTNKMKIMVNKIGTFGIRNKILGAVIASSPQLLLRKPSEFLEVVSLLEEIGLDDETIQRILLRSPEIFASNAEKTLRKKINLLADFGISKEHLPRVIKKYPEFLVSDVQGNLIPRMKYLMDIGLSKWEVVSMVRRFSPLLGYSIDMVLQPKIEYLLKTMNKSLNEVVEYPRYLSYSLEKKIKPRYCILKGRNIQCSLKDMLGKNNEEFAEDYMGIERMLVLPPSLSPHSENSQ